MEVIKFDKIGALAIGKRSPYDLTLSASDTFPSEDYVAYLQKPSVTSAIGAQSEYTQCATPLHKDFDSTGDVSRDLLGLSHFLIWNCATGCEDIFTPIGNISGIWSQDLDLGNLDTLIFHRSVLFILPEGRRFGHYVSALLRLLLRIS